VGQLKKVTYASTFFGGCGKISVVFFYRVSFYCTPLVAKRPKTRLKEVDKKIKTRQKIKQSD
jgi:hypothetical protein